MAYRLDLPEELWQIHNTFHVSQLRKCLVDDSTVIPLEYIQVDDCLNYIEKQVTILERKTKDLRNQRVELGKVQWQHRKQCFKNWFLSWAGMIIGSRFNRLDSRVNLFL